MTVELQISAIVSSKRLRGEMCGLSSDTSFVMPITNGSSIFYAVSHFDEIDGKRYHRMAFSPVRTLDFPIRLAHFANAQLFVSRNPLQWPDALYPTLLCASNIAPSPLPPRAQSALSALRSQTRQTSAARSSTFAARNQETSVAVRSTSFQDFGALTRGFRSPTSRCMSLPGGTAPTPSVFFSSIRCVTNLQAFPICLMQGLQSVAPLSSPHRSSSPPLHLPPTGTFNFDGYLAAHHDMTVYTSTSFPDLVFKFAVEGTEAGLELENEAITYSRLYNAAPCSASSFAVQYIGYYLCPDSCRVVLVLERGTPLYEVDVARCVQPVSQVFPSCSQSFNYRQDVLELLNKAHAAGVIHGDVAPRNLVRTPRGLRLIDWGRARFAEGAAACREDYDQLVENSDLYARSPYSHARRARLMFCSSTCS